MAKRPPTSKEECPEIKRERIEALMIVQKKKVYEAAVNYRHRELTKLLTDKTLVFEKSEINDIHSRFFNPIKSKYRSQPGRSALLTTLGILCDDGRFPISPDEMSKVCNYKRRLTDVLHVIFAHSCSDATAAALYDHLHTAIKANDERMLQFMLVELDTFNINRDMNREHGLPGYGTVMCSRALHMAINHVTTFGHSPAPTPMWITSMILNHPNIQPNVRTTQCHPTLNRAVAITPIDYADRQYNDLRAAALQLGNIEFEGFERLSVEIDNDLKNTANVMFLMLSHDAVDIHTIGNGIGIHFWWGLLFNVYDLTFWQHWTNLILDHNILPFFRRV